MSHSVSHMLRCVTGKQLTAQALCDRLKNRDGEMQSNMFSLMANLRGSKEFFAKLSMNVRWMIKQLGPPTLFVTLSTAEWFSDPFIEYLRTVNSTVPNISNMTPSELCALDPVNVSIHFNKKWKAIFSKLIKNQENPLFGEVSDYFIRTEFQQRGSPHIHACFWLVNAPLIGKDSPEDVKRFIETHITCAKPDPNGSPTLSDLVNRFQTHKCNNYCIKTFKMNGKFFKKCRFGFPRPIRAELHLNDVVDCMAVAKNHQPRKRLYHLQRCDGEQRINDYNPALLLANQGNVDVQYCGTITSRLPYYITEYMSKRERSEQDEMWQDIFSSSKSLGTNAMSLLLKSLKNRQVGACEAASRLLGHKLYSMSRQIRFADLQPSNMAKRVLKTSTEIEKMLEIDPDSNDIFTPHWVLNVYPDRPDELETCSLFEFLGWHERVLSSGNKDEKLRLKTLPYYLRRRQAKPYIVTHQVVNPHHSEECCEKYYYYLLKLFKPWRNESELISPGTSYHEMFLLEKGNLPDMAAYHEKNTQSSQQDKEMENAVRSRAQQLRETAAESTADDVEGALQGCIVDHAQSAMQELRQSHSRLLEHTDDEALSKDYEGLNIEQRHVVDLVIEHVHDEKPGYILL